jgi:hypothetical protein
MKVPAAQTDEAIEGFESGQLQAPFEALKDFQIRRFVGAAG